MEAHCWSLHPARPVFHLLRLTGSAFKLGAAIRRRTVHYCGSISQSCALVWHRARFLFSTSSYTADIQKLKINRSPWRSGSVYICKFCMLTTHSFLAPACLWLQLTWLPEPWTSSALWKPGSRQIGFDWMLIRLGLSGPGSRHNRWVSKVCQVCYFHLRQLWTVRRSLAKEPLLMLVHAFVTSLVSRCNVVLRRSIWWNCTIHKCPPVRFSWWPHCSEFSASDIWPSGFCCSRPPKLELIPTQN